MADVPRVDALLLDFGNVLVPIDFARATGAWAAAAGKPHDAVHPRFSHDEAFRAYERDEIDGAAYFGHLRAALGLDLPDERLLEGWNAIFLEPEAETGRLVEELSHRYPLYLFSNTNRAHWAHWSTRYAAMLSRFKGVFTSFELGARKPEAVAFRRVVERIGVPASRIAFFDDLEENAAGARRAGLQGFRVRRAADIHRALA